MTPNADQITYWNEMAGSRWVRNNAALKRLLEPFSRDLIAAAALKNGDRVLEIGCGCGDLTFAVAEAVGAEGHVTAVDVSRPMLAFARSNDARPSSRAVIDWVEADASTMPFAPDIDVAVSQFGVMFFDDRARAFANLRTALNPNGRMLFLAWCGRREVEWMQAPLDWIANIFPPPAPSDNETGPFAFADPLATTAMLAAAGFDEVDFQRLDRKLHLGATIDEAVHLVESVGPASACLRDADTSLQSEARSAIRRALEMRQDRTGSVYLESAVWLYRGLSKPSR